MAAGVPPGVAMSLPWRVTLIVGFFGMILGLSIYGAMAWLRGQPPNVSFVNSQAPGKAVHLTVQTVGTMGPGHAHPAWVSYLVKAPDGAWIHSTQWQVPAYTRIDVTVLQYDGGVTLRNQVLGKVTGTVGGYMTVNGKRMTMITPNTGHGETHTFTIPGLGVNVPLVGVNGNAKNFCTVAPCKPSDIHNVIKFSFYSGAPRQYHWQCFYPCAAGFLDGNGGPMQTLGYMDGFLKVQPQPGHPLQVGQ